MTAILSPPFSWPPPPSSSGPSLVTLLRRTAAPTDEQSRQLLDEARAQAASERDAAIRAALEQSAVLDPRGDRRPDRRHAGRARCEEGADRRTPRGRERRRRRAADSGRGPARRSQPVERGVARPRSSEQLQMHASTTRSLADTTQGLREALASTQDPGPVGRAHGRRRAAPRRLRRARQLREADRGRGRPRRIPDFTFLLPKGHVLYMDVKFPLDRVPALPRGRPPTTERIAATVEQFLRDVRLKVQELAGRDYARPALDSSCRPACCSSSRTRASTRSSTSTTPRSSTTPCAQKIVLCSPLTLFAMLGVIRQAFDKVMVEQTSDEVLRLVGAFAHAVRQVHRRSRDARPRLRLRADSVRRPQRHPATRALERPLRQDRRPAP